MCQTMFSPPGPADEVLLERLQWVSLSFYLRHTNPKTGLVADKSQANSAASITAVGMFLASVPIAVQMDIISRLEAIDRVLRVLRFFNESRQGPGENVTGYKGFYYHFLDMDTGLRARPDTELSTLDTGFLIAGILTAATYFNGETEDEAEIRQLADVLYRRVDWTWALNGGATLSHGWTPTQKKFIEHRYVGYDESLLLNILALASPTHPIPPDSYRAWRAGFAWKTLYGIEHLYSGPLFTHQFSHIWIDFRGIQDDFMRERGSDYFRNSQCATYLHQRYAIANPLQYEGYGETCWGLTACNGPAETENKEMISRRIQGIQRTFYNYTARGAPFGIDDGTIAPWAVFASLPFCPEIVLPTIRHFEAMDLGRADVHGYRPSFNMTFTREGNFPPFWVSPDRFGIDQGPIILMIENYQTRFLWDLMKRCPYIVAGLQQAGFKGGWLDLPSRPGE